MTDTQATAPEISLGLLPRVLKTSHDESERVAKDRFLRDAFEQELRIGQRISSVARTTAILVIAVLLLFLNPTWGVLYYEALLFVFLAIGWVRQALIRRGMRIPEIWLVVPEILLLVFVSVVPSPFMTDRMPAAFVYQFENFSYFYLILALCTLAYSWRTIWNTGLLVAVLWLGAALAIGAFGHRMPELSEATAMVYGRFAERFEAFFDPNSVHFMMRVQEVVVFVLVAAILTLKSWRTNQLIARQAELAGERANLSRYFAPTVVEALARSDGSLARARSHEVGVMFTDIVGFTDIAERYPTDEVMELLRRYYAAIERVVFENGGTLDKYLGDGVMATFGTPEPGEADAANALRAALAVVAAIDALDAALPEGSPPVRVSVGVHFGQATIGNVGPARRLEFAVIGDTVNVAKRLETVTRDLGCRLAVSEAAMARAGAATGGDSGGWRRAEGVALRGRAAPVDVWAWGEAPKRAE
ncbi:MAG: adenylate/guanylate cyclase domain-containing protein [Paracoccaceae bacterium]